MFIHEFTANSFTKEWQGIIGMFSEEITIPKMFEFFLRINTCSILGSKGVKLTTV